MKIVKETKSAYKFMEHAIFKGMFVRTLRIESFKSKPVEAVIFFQILDLSENVCSMPLIQFCTRYRIADPKEYLAHWTALDQKVAERDELDRDPSALVHTFNG